MIPAELCHYTTKEKGLKILGSKSLKFGQIKYVNDPAETQIVVFNMSVPDHMEEILNHELSTNQEKHAADILEYQRVRTEEWKLACFTASRENPEDILSPNVYQFVKQSHYFKNISEKEWPEFFKNLQNWPEFMKRWIDFILPGYCHPRMWDQYAERHQGICFIFDGAKLNNKIKKEMGNKSKIFQGMVSYVDFMSYYGTQSVEYEDIIKIGATEAARTHFFKYFNRYFLTKNLDWERETEFRWLIHNSTNAPEFIPIEGTLLHVLVGMNYSREELDDLISLCKELMVPVGNMSWSGGLPMPEFGRFFTP